MHLQAAHSSARYSTSSRSGERASCSDKLRCRSLWGAFLLGDLRSGISTRVTLRKCLFEAGFRFMARSDQPISRFYRLTDHLKAIEKSCTDNGSVVKKRVRVFLRCHLSRTSGGFNGRVSSPSHSCSCLRFFYAWIKWRIRSKPDCPGPNRDRACGRDGGPEPGCRKSEFVHSASRQEPARPRLSSFPLRRGSCQVGERSIIC